MDKKSYLENRPMPLSPQGAAARAMDLASIVVSALVAEQIRFSDADGSQFDITFVAFSCAFMLVLFPASGIYQSHRGRSQPWLIGRLALAWVVVQGCALALTFSLHRTGAVSRLWFAYWTGLTGAALICIRLATQAVLRRVRHAGLNLRTVAVVGHGQYYLQVLRNIAQAPESGFRAVAVLNPDPVPHIPTQGIETFNDYAAFVAYVRRLGTREIWLALPLSDEHTIMRFVTEFHDELVNLRYMPDISMLSLFDGGMTNILGVPALNLAALPLPQHALVVKEIFDRCFAAAALVALSPLMAVIAIAIKATSRGPVFFRQRRKGADGNVFRIYKFRTMRLHVEQPGVVEQATRTDTRVTRLGRVLRRTSLDELPQFINVLLGDMSVVGPRPHAIEHDELYRKIVDGYIQRYRIKPGITGWAQINGYRGETDRVEKMRGRVEHDLYYLRNWSFALDMQIVGKTILKGFSGGNAY